MEIKEMNFDELETRRAELAAEIDNADMERLTAINAELDEIEARKAALKTEAEERAKTIEEVLNAPEPTPIVEERTNTMETRNTKEYIDAFAEYIKSGDDKECRALLTETVSGTVPVPAFVDEIIRTAWEKNDILARVRKTFLKGNLKVAFERSADGAYIHTEGTSAPTEESLTLGIVTMIPRNIKKWITISDEAVTMGGEAFVRYIYDELTYQIIKKLSDEVVGDIAGLSTSSSATAPAAAKVTLAPALATIPTAFAALSDEAADPVIIMNKATYANFVAAQAAAHYAFDPFMNLPVLFSNKLPAYDSASTNAVYAIVGDLNGAQVNYPEGDDVVIKWDDTTLAEKDLVKVIGRQYVGHGVTANGRFTNIAKPSTT